MRQWQISSTSLSVCWDRMSAKTKETMHFGQLQEGLYGISKRACSLGALGYKELAAAAKTKECRLAEPRKRQGYQRQPKATSAPKQPPTTSAGEK